MAPLSLAVAAGCQALIGLDGGHATTGSGGSGGSSTSTSSSTSSSTSTSTSSSTSSTSTSSSTSSSTSTGSTGTGGMGTGGAAPGVLLLAVGAGQGLFGSAFDGAAWSAPTSISGVTSAVDPALAVVPSTGQGIGLAQSATSGQLEYTVWDGKAWAPFNQLHGDLTQGVPGLTAIGDTAHVVYWGTDFNYYHESFSASTWAAATSAIVPAGVTSLCGPSAGALAPVGSSPSLVFVNGSCSGTVNHLYDSDLSGSAWQAPKDIATNPSYSATQRPAVTAPGSGPELVAAFVQQGGQQILTAARTSGTWAAPATLASGLTNDPVALAPLAGGGAVLAYRGTDGNLYTSTFDGASWSAPSSPTTMKVASTPAVAQGAGAAAAELAFVDGNGALQHLRYVGTSWTAATQIGSATGFTHVAIASGP